MRKRDELNPENKTCTNTARDDEMLFVLIGRDVAAPSTIRFWCDERIRLRKNKITDPQICEALACADTMEREREAATLSKLQHKKVQYECVVCCGLGSIEVTGQRCLTCGGSGWR